MSIFMPFFIFAVGASIGSFLNVCIFRIPEGTSIVLPGSRCMNCGKSLKFYDNIPIISYLLLRGACRSCGVKLSLQYPAVEALTGIMALLLFFTFGLSWSFLFTLLFTASLIVVTVIDLRHQIIPHVITLPGIPFFFLAGVFFMGVKPLDAFLGIMIGAGCLYFVAVYYEWLTEREGMGGGDVNLLAMMGAFLGWQSLIYIVLTASLSGAIIGIAAMAWKGKDSKFAIPFGPFLSLGALSYLFFGDWFMALLMAR